MYHPTSVRNASGMQFDDIISWRDRTCVLKVIYSMRLACA